MRMPSRFADRPAAQQRGWGFMAVLGLLALAAVGALVYVGFNAPNAIPGRSYYTVQAEFDNADNLTGHYQVRVGGRIVGQVLDARVENGKAVVDLQMEPDVGPLKSDSEAEVRPRSAVGVRYVDVTPGTSGTPLPEGGRIPSSQTKATTQLDEVLGTFDPRTRVRAQQFLRELGTGFAGRGEDNQATLQRAPVVLDDADSVLSEIARDEDAFGRLVRGAESIAAATDPVHAPLADGFAVEARALRPFRQARGAVQTTLEKAPGTFTDVRGDLARTDPMLRALAGFMSAARPALTAAPASLRQTSALLAESRPGLRAAKDTLELAEDAVDPALGLLTTVKPVLPDIESALGDATPLVTTLGRHGCDIIDFGKGWTTMQEYGNAGGGILRFNLQAGPESLVGNNVELPGVPSPREAYPAPCTVKQYTDNQGG